MKDLHSKLGFVSLLAPVILAATSTSTALDLQGFNSVLVTINTGAIAGSGDFTTILQHSDSSSSDFVDVAATDLIGEFPASLTADASVKVGYKGSKRYLRTVTTKNSGTSIAASILAVRSHAADSPVV